MNPIDDQLGRLFRAAAKVTTTEATAAPPYGLETRVMAAWRAGAAADAGLWDMALLVRGLFIAVVIMAVSFWPVFTTTTAATDPFSEYVQLADSTISSDVSQ
jgi:hypothetical protein